MGRILAISDIHGQKDKLDLLLEVINYNPKEDQLMILGDLVDRGNQNISMILRAKELQQQGAIIIKGNHDEMAEQTLYELFNNKPAFNSKLHIQCGGENTYNEFLRITPEMQEELYNFLSKLPCHYEIGNYIFVHAGVSAYVPLDRNDDEDFMWSRELFINSKAYPGKTVIFGHTPTAYMINGIYDRRMADARIWRDPIYKDKIGIDCGSIFGGKLACLELPSGKEYYI